MKTKIRAAGALCAVSALVGTGCSSTTTLQTVSNPVAERRTMVDPSAPVVTSEWKLEGSKVTGRVSWASCVSQRSWTTEQQRTVHRRPIPAAGWGLVLGGVALTTVGLATHDSRLPEPACPSDPGAAALQMAYGSSCGRPAPNNTASTAAFGVGMLAVATGIGVLSVSASDQTVTLHSEPHAETATVPCISPADLSTLVLVLKLGDNQFVHVELGPNGDASIELPSSVRLPRSARLAPGADLPIVVYRAPRAADSILPRWQVVGVVHIPE